MVNAELSALRYHVVVCSKGREYRPNVAQVWCGMIVFTTS